MHDGMPYDQIQGQGHTVICDLLKRIPRWLLRGVDRQSRTGLFYFSIYTCKPISLFYVRRQSAPVTVLASDDDDDDEQY